MFLCTRQVSFQADFFSDVRCEAAPASGGVGHPEPSKPVVQHHQSQPIQCCEEAVLGKPLIRWVQVHVGQAGLASSVGRDTSGGYGADRWVQESGSQLHAEPFLLKNDQGPSFQGHKVIRGYKHEVVGEQQGRAQPHNNCSL
jgi:hypothetical protein